MTPRVRAGLAGGVAVLVAGCLPPVVPGPAPAAPSVDVGAVPAPLAGATQLVVVTTSGWDSISGAMHRYVRESAGGQWRAVGRAVPIVVGRGGLGWGVGFEHPGPRKVEGDGRAPAGIFSLGTAFGFATRESVRDVRMPYLTLTPAIECVDDVASAHYNRVLDRRTVAADWTSSEKMRQVEQYRLGVVVDYNAAPPVAGRGSCIFLHIWGGPRSPTVGCTALDEAELARLVAWLDPQARPVVVQLPAGEYARLRGEWELPSLAP